MSFQHFRLGELALHQPLPPHLVGSSTTTSFSARPPDNAAPTSSSKQAKQPYGSGDSDDGYTLVFPNVEAFQAWRATEEERQSVEFVKGDTHGSKAVPPRFKDHTKLVCARHSRSGRKKYVKKHPDRVRKVPSRKLEGIGCPASISYKTYFDSDEVRACYVSQHSHEIGLANLPFTRRGRKAVVQREKEKSRNTQPSGDASSAVAGAAATPVVTPATNAAAGPSSTSQTANMFSPSVSMIAPLPGQRSFQPPPPPAPPAQPFNYQPGPQPFTAPPPAQPVASHDRWENMTTLFHSIRDHARTYEYPAVSVAALETILIRLYLESPVNVGIGVQPAMSAVMQTMAAPQNVAPVAPQIQTSMSTGSNTSEDSMEEA